MVDEVSTRPDENLPIVRQGYLRHHSGHQAFVPSTQLGTQAFVPPPVQREHLVFDKPVVAETEVVTHSPVADKTRNEPSHLVESKAYNPDDERSALIDGDAAVEDDFEEGVYEIYLRLDEKKIESMTIEIPLVENLSNSIRVPESNADDIVVMCRGYKNYTYNWYRDGGGKRQGCGMVDDEK